MTTISINLDQVSVKEEDLIARGDGRHSIPSIGDAEVYAHVNGGAITGYSAEKGGIAAPVKTFAVQVGPINPTDATEVHCFITVCVNDSCGQVEIPCASATSH